MTTWVVTARLGKRERDFSLEAVTKAEAKSKALNLIAEFYSHYSGTLGNQVWREGRAVLTDERHNDPVVLY